MCLKEIVYEEELLQERLRSFSKTGYIFRGMYLLRKKFNMNTQALFKHVFVQLE